MQRPPPAPLAVDLLLVGGGHAHVHLLKMFGMDPIASLLRSSGVRVTLLSAAGATPYSGMLPGFVAGRYSSEDIHVDLAALCEFAGARFVRGRATAVQHGEKGGKVEVDHNTGRPDLRYDVLSFDVGCLPRDVPERGGNTAVKPIDGFAARWEDILRQHRRRRENGEETRARPYRVVVVGGGAGGVELALAVHHRLVDPSEGEKVRVALVTRSDDVLMSHNAKVRRIFRRILEERGIDVRTKVTPTTENDGRTSILKLVHPQKETETMPYDECLWCTGAKAPKFLAERTPFECTDVSGFIKVKATFESVSHPNVFAAGDCADNVDFPRPKAGVFAVRAGPPLLQNLIAALTGKPLLPHRPQTQFLSLISTGDEYAVASRGPWAFEHRYLWKLKDHIDRRWMNMYSALPDMTPNTTAPLPDAVALRSPDVVAAFRASAMRCGGCGAKVGSTVVSRVLRSLRRRARSRPIPPGLPPDFCGVQVDADDAAVTHLPPSETGHVLVHTLDYFRSFLSDPYVFGRVAAAHAMSDVHAMGLPARGALALAVVPHAAAEEVAEETLEAMLAGGADALTEDGCVLVGGHTCEGTELGLGFAVHGIAEVGKDGENEAGVLRKGGMTPGDVLVLTKPLGTGAVFAAHMRAKCKARHVEEALQYMVMSNGAAGKLAAEWNTTVSDDGDVPISACTDITGFGLMGHLLEMVLGGDSKGTKVNVEIDLKKVPFLTGALRAATDGTFSSLQRENIRSRRAVSNHAAAEAADPVRYPLLYDPQTSGGLLFAVRPERAVRFVEALREKGYRAAVPIGRVVASASAGSDDGEDESDDEQIIGEGTCPAPDHRVRILLHHDYLKKFVNK